MKGLTYIETRAVLRVMLEGDLRVGTLLERDEDLASFTSALTFVEAERALVRAEGTGRISSEEREAHLENLRVLREGYSVIRMNRSILRRAGQPFPVEPIRTLDAIHLATALFVREEAGAPVSIVSVDQRVLENARSLGFEVAVAG